MWIMDVLAPFFVRFQTSDCLTGKTDVYRKRQTMHKEASDWRLQTAGRRADAAWWTSRKREDEKEKDCRLHWQLCSSKMMCAGWNSQHLFPELISRPPTFFFRRIITWICLLNVQVFVYFVSFLHVFNFLTLLCFNIGWWNTKSPLALICISV